jgi:hypothetical protein
MIQPTTNELYLFALLESDIGDDSPGFVALAWTDALQNLLWKLRDLVNSEDLASASVYCAAEFPDEAHHDCAIDGQELKLRASGLTFHCYDAASDCGAFEAPLGDIAALEAAASAARLAGRRYFVAPGTTLDTDAVEAFLQERDARAAADALLIDEDTFRDVWGATAAPSGDLFQHAEVAQLGLHHVWTVVEGERDHWIASPGFHVVNRLGYVTTTKPWDDHTPDAFWIRGD